MTKKSERKITCFDAIQTGGTTLPAQAQLYRARKAGGCLDGDKLCDIFTYTQKGKIKPKQANTKCSRISVKAKRSETTQNKAVVLLHCQHQ